MQPADVAGLGRVEEGHRDAAGVQGSEEGDQVLEVLRAQDRDPVAWLGDLLQSRGDRAVAHAEVGPVQVALDAVALDGEVQEAVGDPVAAHLGPTLDVPDEVSVVGKGDAPVLDEWVVEGHAISPVKNLYGGSAATHCSRVARRASPPSTPKPHRSYRGPGARQPNHPPARTMTLARTGSYFLLNVTGRQCLGQILLTQLRTGQVQPCFGCGALSITPRAQFSVHSVAGWPLSFQNWVVPYSACTGWPAPPASTSSVCGRLVMLKAPCGAAQIRSPDRADLVGAVVERTEPARPLAGHRQTQAREHRHLVQRDLGALPRWVGPTSWPTPV